MEFVGGIISFWIYFRLLSLSVYLVALQAKKEKAEARKMAKLAKAKAKPKPKGKPKGQSKRKSVNHQRMTKMAMTNMTMTMMAQMMGRLTVSLIPQRTLLLMRVRIRIWRRRLSFRIRQMQPWKRSARI